MSQGSLVKGFVVGRSRRVVAGVGVLSAVVVGLASAGSSPAAADSAAGAAPTVAELACAGASGYPASIPVSFTKYQYNNAGGQTGSAIIGMAPATLPAGAGAVTLAGTGGPQTSTASSRALDSDGTATYTVAPFGGGSAEYDFTPQSASIGAYAGAGGGQPYEELTFDPVDGSNFCAAVYRADFVKSMLIGRSAATYIFGTPYKAN